MNKLVTISKIWNYFQGCSNSAITSNCEYQTVFYKQLGIRNTVQYFARSGSVPRVSFALEERNYFLNMYLLTVLNMKKVNFLNRFVSLRQLDQYLIYGSADANTHHSEFANPDQRHRDPDPQHLLTRNSNMSFSV